MLQIRQGLSAPQGGLERGKEGDGNSVALLRSSRSEDIVSQADASSSIIQHYRVAINDSTAATIGRIFRFVYTCNSTEDAKSVLVELRQVELISIARRADMYGLSPLFEAACRMLEQMSQDGVDTDSIIFDILEFAHQYERLSLRQSMLALLGKRFEVSGRVWWCPVLQLPSPMP